MRIDLITTKRYSEKGFEEKEKRTKESPSRKTSIDFESHLDYLPRPTLNSLMQFKSFQNRRNRRNAGYSIIESLVVIVILVLMTWILVPGLFKTTDAKQAAEEYERKLEERLRMKEEREKAEAEAAAEAANLPPAPPPAIDPDAVDPDIGDPGTTDPGTPEIPVNPPVSSGGTGLVIP